MDFKKEFPLLKKITYLDNASGTLKPKKVVDVIQNYYLKNAINPHSHNSRLGIVSNKMIGNTRLKIANLVNANPQEVIFTSGATDALNKIARMLEPVISKGEIVVSKYNHDSNVIPWIELAKRKKMQLIVSNNPLQDISTKTKIVAISQVNNAFGEDVDLDSLYQKAKKVNAIVINDAAQAITSQKVFLNNCDVIVLSGNKIYGPTGTGALIIKESLLQKLTPSTYGGGTIASIDFNQNYVFKKNNIPFEPGTPNTAGIVGLGVAIDFFLENFYLIKKMKLLSIYAWEKLKEMKNVEIYTKPSKNIILFNLKNIAAQDVISSLGHQNIYLRSGMFCNNLGTINKNGAIRISLAIYNSKKDIDKMIKVLKKGEFFDFL